MVTRVAVSPDCFDMHGEAGAGSFGPQEEFDADGFFLLMEEGDVLPEADFEKIEQAVSRNPRADLFLLPKKYGPTRGNKEGMRYAPFSVPEKQTGSEADFSRTEIISPEQLPLLHSFIPFGMIFRGRLLLERMRTCQKEMPEGIPEEAQAMPERTPEGISDGRPEEVQVMLERMPGGMLPGSGYETLRRLFELQAEACAAGKLVYIPDVDYTLKNSFEGDETFFRGIYDRAWYERTLHFLEDCLDETARDAQNIRNAEGVQDTQNGPDVRNVQKDPVRREARDTQNAQNAGMSVQSLLHRLWMQHAFFIAKYMIQANLDNRNKHLFEGGEADAILWKLGELLTRVEDRVICENRGCHVSMKNEDCLLWVLLILKYRDESLEFDFVKAGAGTRETENRETGTEEKEAGVWKDRDSEKETAAFPGGRKEPAVWFYGFHGNLIHPMSLPTADIQFMDQQDGPDGTGLTIEGRVSPVLLMHGAEFGVQVGERFYPAVPEERYAHTKAFGRSIFRLRAFSVRVTLPAGKERTLSWVSRWGETEFPVTLEYDSDFSRLCNRFAHSYWKINRDLYMVPGRANEMLVRPVRFGRIFGRELALWRDMLSTGQKKVIKFILVRFFLKAKPLLKHRPVWLFFDKIYKAGDSAEYLYRYARAQKDGVRCYYLADGGSEDFARLKQEGLKPVKRRSLLHRYAFLYADMVIVSNSTVYAFNDFGTVNSALIRDLMNFHVACVQHGLSVQKIAVAQNRLRDNTRLYFCASRYEIENLSKPVYGYQGHDALKLTGVPRYDGLVNEEKRQILISPTWRMQAAVPVTKNEGMSRDYNPLFKETTYYKVYNGLINDRRLIEAARACHYRLVYVLHPIVSPQIGDFDTNPYVEILPAAAAGGRPGVNYEKVFRESSLMVTDFSGVQFDFAYMRKPVVYLHHKEIPKHYEEGTFHYDTMGFGEICRDNEELIDVLIAYMRNNCQMKPEYRRRADDFFAFDDHENCRRVYDVMIDYQRRVIGR